MKPKANYVKTIKVIDPDSKAEVELEIYKMVTGGMFAVDSSFIALDEPIYSPFDKNIEIDPKSFG